MNLLFDTWIPVVAASGEHRLIAPTALGKGDDPPIELAAVRHDFDGALAQFLIGLLQSFLPPRTDRAWEQGLAGPPSEQTLASAFEPWRHAFELFHAQTPFMQDISLSDAFEGADSIYGLLLDAPGANTEKENKDIFVKRGKIDALAPEIAAQALICLQLNAPTGGVGYRTSLRGGGPLTTLVWPRRRGDGQATTLWQKLWLNVLPVDWSSTDVDWTVALPWLKPARTSRKGDHDEVIQHGALRQGRGPDPLCYWSCPRRLRLVRGSTPQRCSLSGRIVDSTVTGLREENYGSNYASDHFRHPLSAYYRSKPDSPQWLPVRPRPGGLGFRDWPALCATTSADESRMRQPAATVAALGGNARSTALHSQLGLAHHALWVFGQEFDNAKLLTWQESTLPLFPECDDPAELAQFAQNLVDAAETARSLLRTGLKEVLGDADVALTNAAERRLVDRAEPDFYASLTAFIALPPPSADAVPDRALRENWARQMRWLLLQEFEAVVESADVVADSGMRLLKKAAEARSRILALWQAQYRKALNLPEPDDARPRSRKPRSPA